MRWPAPLRLWATRRLESMLPRAEARLADLETELHLLKLGIGNRVAVMDHEARVSRQRERVERMREAVRRV